mgnify:FL=1
MKKCSNCGNDILDNLIRCPYCGSRQEKKEPDDSTETADRQEIKNREASFNEEIQNIGKNIEKVKESDWFSKLRTPQGALKLYSVIAGFIYIYFACSCIQYLGYYSSLYKMWGNIMIAVCILNAGIYFRLFFKSKYKRNKWIFYGLIGGAVIKSILHIVQIQWSFRYEYWDASAGAYLPVVWTVIITIIGLLLLRNTEKNEMTETVQENIYEQQRKRENKKILP